VRWIFRTYGESGVSLRWLRYELNRRGVPSPTGRAWWAPNTLRGLLRRREYVGDYDWGEEHHGGYHGLEGRRVKVTAGKKVLNSKGTAPKRTRLRPEDFVIVENTHEALIDRALWEKVQAKLARNAKHTTPYTNGGDWVLTGLLVCAHCGSSMVGHTNRAYSRRTGKVYRRYRCNGYHSYGTRHCHPHNVDERAVLDCLVRKLQEDFLNPDNLAALRAELRRQADAGREPARLHALRTQLVELESKIERGHENLLLLPAQRHPALLNRLGAWETERDQLAGRLAELEKGADRAESEALLDEAEKCLWQLREALASADVPRLRAVLREMVVKVECWWSCRPARLRQRCDFRRGLIHLRTDLRINRLVQTASAALWL
jgi:site-specific DNA recombinase